jgi:hypothetical protein
MRTVPSKRIASNPLEGGWAELGEAQWGAARKSFKEALANEETPEAFEGLSWAAWWLDNAAVVFDARERAYRLLQERGDAAGAAQARDPSCAFDAVLASIPTK